MNLSRMLSPAWAMNITRRYAPFADAASVDLPLGRLLRLSMFQLSIGITIALLVGTLNRVMIVELGVPAWWVALSVALPLVFAPLRALIGYRSDTHPSALGLKRMPYMWIGTILMFGGLAIMPFALLLLSLPAGHGVEVWAGRIGAALAFLLVGAGMQITQTAGLALASDISPEDKRPRVVALLYSTLLVGMILGSALLGFALIDFTPTRLVQVVQGAAVLVAVLNITSLWKQEPRQARRGAREAHGFSRSWARLMAIPKIKRFLWTVGLGTVAFNMQDIILEPYGGQVLGLNVSLTSSLTAMSAGGALLAFVLSARFMARGLDTIRLAAIGALLGLPAFACVIFSAPLNSAPISTQPATSFQVGISTPEFRPDDATLSYDTDAATPIPILALAAPASSLSWTIIHPSCCYCLYRRVWEYCSGGEGHLIAWGGSIANPRCRRRGDTPAGGAQEGQKSILLRLLI